MNYDLVTYHFYLGHTAFADRLELDYLAASFQGYQSPLPYALLYLLDTLGAPAPVNASIHACIHALNLILLYLIAEQIVDRDAARRTQTIVAFWILGAIAPIYWNLVGTSFADLLTSVGVLGALALAVKGVSHWSFAHDKSRALLFMAGAVMGAVAGIRIHNTIYVVGLLCAVALLIWNKPQHLGTLVKLAAASMTGWALAFVTWAVPLYREFGNPVFPFYNGLFRAQQFPAANLPLTSFVPEHGVDMLALPFRMATYSQWLYAESILPDIRPAMMVLSATVLSVIAVLKKVWTPGRPASGPACLEPGDEAVSRRIIGMFFAVSGVLWLLTSSNARYGAALFMLLGPLCGLLLSRLLSARHVFLVIAAIVIWQILVEHALFAHRRTAYAPWTTRYFDWDLPDRIRYTPVTLLSFGYQTASSMVPRMHPRSRHANLVGQYTVNIDAAGSERIREMIAAPGRPVYGVFDYRYTEQDVPGARSIKVYFRQHLHLWGLDFDDEPCQVARLRSDEDAWSRLNRLLRSPRTRRPPPRYLVCGLRAAQPSLQEGAAESYRRFKTRLARLATGCSHLSEPLTYTRAHQRWIVTSFASFETTFDFQDEGPFYIQQMRPPYVALEVGRVQGEEIVPTVPDCNRWFAELSRISDERLRNYRAGR